MDFEQLSIKALQQEALNILKEYYYDLIAMEKTIRPSGRQDAQHQQFSDRGEITSSTIASATKYRSDCRRILGLQDNRPAILRLLKGVMWKVVGRECGKYRKQKTREREYANSRSTTEKPNGSRYEIIPEDLEYCIAGVGEENTQVIRAHFVDGLSLIEIAREENVVPSAITPRKKRELKLLLEAVEKRVTQAPIKAQSNAGTTQ